MYSHAACDPAPLKIPYRKTFLRLVVGPPPGAQLLNKSTPNGRGDGKRIYQIVMLRIAIDSSSTVQESSGHQNENTSGESESNAQ